MLAIPQKIATKYETLLVLHDIPVKHRSYYFKWLRYYFDFCNKYHLEPYKRDNFSAFDKKLSSKNQSETQHKQAKRAIAIYYRDIVGLPIADQKTQTETIREVNLQKGNHHLKENREIMPNLSSA